RRNWERTLRHVGRRLWCGVGSRPECISSDRPDRGEKPMSIESINPVSGEVLERFDETSTQELDSVLASAHAVFLDWRTVPFAARALRMRDAARVLRARRTEYAR